MPFFVWFGRAIQIVKTVELVKKLHQSSLNLLVGRGAIGGIDLIHEDNARLVLLSIGKQLSDDSYRLANVFINNCRSDDFKKRGFDITR
jgi:hypothetical protein